MPPRNESVWRWALPPTLSVNVADVACATWNATLKVDPASAWAGEATGLPIDGFPPLPAAVAARQAAAAAAATRKSERDPTMYRAVLRFRRLVKPPQGPARLASFHTIKP